MARYVEYDEEREKIRIGMHNVEYVMSIEDAKELESWLKWALIAAAKKKHGMKVGRTYYGKEQK